jgi:hypothetical protein
MNLYSQYLSALQLFFATREEPTTPIPEEETPLDKAA